MAQDISQSLEKSSPEKEEKTLRDLSAKLDNLNHELEKVCEERQGKNSAVPAEVDLSC